MSEFLGFLKLLWIYRVQIAAIARAVEGVVEGYEDREAREKRATAFAQAVQTAVSRKDTSAIDAFLQSGGVPVGTRGHA